MAPRLQLQTKLKDILGASNVYFQPPPTIQLSYPCIIYQRDDIRTEFADDKPYKNKTRYKVTVIDKDPDSLVPSKLLDLPLCVYNRFYSADNLNHDVFTLYF